MYTPAVALTRGYHTSRAATATSLGSSCPGAPTAACFLRPLSLWWRSSASLKFPLASIEAYQGALFSTGDKYEYYFTVDWHGNHIVAQKKCKSDHTRTPHNALRREK